VIVPYELNSPSPGAIAVVGRDPGAREEQLGRPFVGKAGEILDSCLSEAGLRRESLNILNVSRERPKGNLFHLHRRDELEEEIARLKLTLHRLKPSVIVTLGNEAAHALVEGWPDTRVPGVGLENRGNIFGATDIENRRGYVFDSEFDCPVIVTVHPAAVARQWVPWRMLLSFDLQRTKELHDAGLRRPQRQVELVTSSRDARNAVKQLRGYRWLASDIETWGDTSLACVGFAGNSREAFVFPARYIDYAGELLRSTSIGKVWVNGIYDLFCLKYREEVEVRGRQDDAMILWHAAYPELAGKKEDKKKAKMTRKSLAFLASLSTFDEWWKGVYETEEEFFIYNGKDCCITHDVWEWTKQTATSVGAWPTYEEERKSIWPCVDMLQRGLNVNDELRVERVEALSEGFSEIYDEMNALILPILEREREQLAIANTLRLFEETDPTCKCCGHGAKKQFACWSCVGFEKAPSKAELEEKFKTTALLLNPPKLTKAVLESFLPICHKCCGEPRETRLRWNPNSGDQNKVVLYDVLGLPKKTKDGKLTTDEKAIRGILGSIV